MKESDIIEIQPDISFIEEIKKSGSSDLSTCMQCGSCTAACGLSAGEEQFPRKEMIWAAWGMKDMLLSDADLWMCHQCGDCTKTCPRGVKPGDILAALRKYVMIHYARPKFLARMLDNPVYLPLIILLPVLIISSILLLAGTFTRPEGPVDYSAFFPHAWLNVSFSALFLLAAAGLIISIGDFWSGLSVTGRKDKNRRKDRKMKTVLKGLINVLPEILLHKRFEQCKAQKNRYYTHLLVFWGFITLLVVTLFAILSTIFFNYPLGFWNPIKIAGNLGGLFLISGASVMLFKRIRGKYLNSNYADWFFLVVLLLLGITGFIIEAARFGNWSSAYHLYFIHLVLVWLVILYLPYNKFVHFIFRTVALTALETRSKTDLSLN